MLEHQISAAKRNIEDRLDVDSLVRFARLWARGDIGNQCVKQEFPKPEHMPLILEALKQSPADGALSRFVLHQYGMEPRDGDAPRWYGRTGQTDEGFTYFLDTGIPVLSRHKKSGMDMVYVPKHEVSIGESMPLSGLSNDCTQISFPAMWISVDFVKREQLEGCLDARPELGSDTWDYRKMNPEDTYPTDWFTAAKFCDDMGGRLISASEWDALIEGYHSDDRSILPNRIGGDIANRWGLKMSKEGMDFAKFPPSLYSEWTCTMRPDRDEDEEALLYKSYFVRGQYPNMSREQRNMLGDSISFRLCIDF